MNNNKVKIEITFKEFFERSRNNIYLQQIINNAIISAIKINEIAKQTIENYKDEDVGNLALNGVQLLCELNGIILTNKEEITAEYIADLIDSYGTNN